MCLIVYLSELNMMIQLSFAHKSSTIITIYNKLRKKKNGIEKKVKNVNDQNCREHGNTTKKNAKNNKKQKTIWKYTKSHFSVGQ